MLRELLEQARARGIERLVGEYLPTERNAMVADHYAKLGFTKIAHHGDGATEWALVVADAIVEAPPMDVRRVDLPATAMVAA